MSISVKFLNKTRQFSIQMFEQFEQLIKDQSQVRRIERYHQLKGIKSNTLQTFIYYILLTVHELQIQNYELKCRKEIQRQYIENQMSINIRGYSIMCGHILQISKYKCAHIIYYLIYEKLVSQRYIQDLINLKSKNCKAKRQKTVFDIRTSNWLKRFESQTLPKSLQPQNIQNSIVQQFCNEMKTIFRHQVQGNQLTSSFAGLRKNRKNQEKSKDIKNNMQANSTDRIYANLQWIPIKVHYKENSAIVNKNKNNSNFLLKKSKFDDSIIQINYKQTESSHINLGRQVLDHILTKKNSIIDEICNRTFKIKKLKILTERIINQDQKITFQKLILNPKLTQKDFDNESQLALNTKSMDKPKSKIFSSKYLQKASFQVVNTTDETVANENLYLTRKKQHEPECNEQFESLINFKKQKMRPKRQYKKQMQKVLRLISLTADPKSGKHQPQFINSKQFKSLQDN